MKTFPASVSSPSDGRGIHTSLDLASFCAFHNRSSSRPIPRFSYRPFYRTVLHMNRGMQRDQRPAPSRYSNEWSVANPTGHDGPAPVHVNHGILSISPCLRVPRSRPPLHKIRRPYPSTNSLTPSNVLSSLDVELRRHNVWNDTGSGPCPPSIGEPIQFHGYALHGLSVSCFTLRHALQLHWQPGIRQRHLRQCLLFMVSRNSDPTTIQAWQHSKGIF